MQGDVPDAESKEPDGMAFAYGADRRIFGIKILGARERIDRGSTRACVQANRLLPEASASVMSGDTTIASGIADRYGVEQSG